MECTQRLDYECSQSERICPDQIGFLGILGTKYPVVRGPNKVGRDPQTCSIVLNLNSISRQHAVINILGGTEFMLMDLDSANKTRLNNKPLRAYIPVPLSNGDTVQFGEVFGIFRLLEEDPELPATQAIDIPDTPVICRTKLQQRQATIPESPDISDRDDSFVMPSQPIQQNRFKSPSNKFIKPSKSPSMQSVSSQKIDNTLWKSTKKSDSFNLDESLNDSTLNGDLHEAETQAPYPLHNETADSIYTAATQIPDNVNNSPSIHSLETQMPVPDHLPAVRKVNDQHEMEIDLFAANKENDISIFNAETQMVIEPDSKAKDSENDDIFNANTQLPESPTGNRDIFTADTQIPNEKVNIASSSKSSDIFTADTQMPNENITSRSKLSDIFSADTQIPINKEVESENNNIISADTQLPNANNSKVSIGDSKDKSRLDKSEELILFDELDTQDLADDLQSQPLVLPESNFDNVEDDIPLSQSDTITDDEFNVPEQNSEQDKIKPLKRSARINSDSSTDCEDFDLLPTQKIPPKPSNDDQLTDCEDELLEVTKTAELNNKNNSTDITFEDLATQVIPTDVVDSGRGNLETKPSANNELNIEDLPTQVIPDEIPDKDVSFEDMPTQVLKEDIPNKVTTIPESKTVEEMPSPFKVPLATPLKMKKKDTLKSSDAKSSPSNPTATISKDIDDDDQYYAATQDILDDLCSQREPSPEIIKVNKNSDEANDGKVAEKLPHHENELSAEKIISLDDSIDSIDGEDKVNQFVSKLSAKQISEVIGVEIAKPRKTGSDPSDVEVTPKKVRPFKFMMTELPDSQEIKTSVTLCSKTNVTESSSESEPENDSQENTPVVFRKKKRVKPAVKVDLIQKFDVAALPTRIITRTRKPTARIQESDAETLKRSKNILKPKFLTEQDEDVDSELISENITRLRNKSEKKINKDSSKVDDKSSSKTDSTVKTANKRLNNRTKKQANLMTVDLTEDLDDKPKTSTRRSNETKVTTDDNEVKERPRSRCSNKGKDVKTANKNEEKIEKESKSKTRKTDKSIKKNETQEKITNYTITTLNYTKSESNQPVVESLSSAAVMTRNTRSRNSNKDKNTTKTDKNTDTSKSDKNKDTTKSDKNKETTKSDKKTIPAEDTTKKKRGRPRKNDKDIEKDSQEDKVVNTRTKETDSQEEVRRSKRQRTVKSDSQNLRHEQSTVYNISSGSAEDSPKGLKRVADDIQIPVSKRAKSVVSSATSSEVISLSSSNSSSRRSTPSRGVRPYHVLFTAFPSEEAKARLEELGAVIVNEAAQCSVAVTLSIKRTVKLLCCVGLGRPIVGPAWVQACVDNKALVDPWQYLLKDEGNEQRLHFSLEKTLSGPRNYLRGYNVSATPTVQPSGLEMKQIVESSGGTWKTGGPNWVVVSTKVDAALWPPLVAKGALIVSNEFILTGVLRQQIMIETRLI